VVDDVDYQFMQEYFY